MITLKMNVARNTLLLIRKKERNILINYIKQDWEP